MPRVRTPLIVLAVLVLGSATAAFAGTGPGGHDQGDGRYGHQGKGDPGKRGRVAVARLVNAAGEKVGRVLLVERPRHGVVGVIAHVRGLTPGFHGFHIHTTGLCEPPGFTTAGGHLNTSGAPHGGHAGDLPSLLATADGEATLGTATDRFSLADLRDADGSAVMVHSGPDNFANIPPRYGTPDQETLATGDSGSRVACGVVR
jgi:Cu-Zn family superoxide dismutase